MRKLTAALASAGLIFALSACGDDEPDKDSKDKESQVENTENTESTDTETDVETEETEEVETDEPETDEPDTGDVDEQALAKEFCSIQKGLVKAIKNNDVAKIKSASKKLEKFAKDNQYVSADPDEFQDAVKDQCGDLVSDLPSP